MVVYYMYQQLQQQGFLRYCTAEGPGAETRMPATDCCPQLMDSSISPFHFSHEQKMDDIGKVTVDLEGKLARIEVKALSEAAAGAKVPTLVAAVKELGFEAEPVPN